MTKVYMCGGIKIAMLLSTVCIYAYVTKLLRFVSTHMRVDAICFKVYLLLRPNSESSLESEVRSFLN